MFDDAFTAIARDGLVPLKSRGGYKRRFASLASIEDVEMQDAAIHHSRLALARAENVLEIPEDLEVKRKLAKFASFV